MTRATGGAPAQRTSMERAGWLIPLLPVLYLLAVEAGLGGLLVLQTVWEHDYFGAASLADWMVVPLPIEVALAVPLLGLVAAWRRRLLEPAAVALLIVFGAANTLLWLVGLAAWFLTGCGGGLFCNGGPLG